MSSDSYDHLFYLPLIGGDKLQMANKPTHEKCQPHVINQPMNLPGSQTIPQPICHMNVSQQATTDVNLQPQSPMPAKGIKAFFKDIF